MSLHEFIFKSDFDLGGHDLLVDAGGTAALALVGAAGLFAAA
jgi:hypothetical protein